VSIQVWRAPQPLEEARRLAGEQTGDVATAAVAFAGAGRRAP
jgi:hypothetical protein